MSSQSTQRVDTASVLLHPGSQWLLFAWTGIPADWTSSQWHEDGHLRLRRVILLVYLYHFHYLLHLNWNRLLDLLRLLLARRLAHSQHAGRRTCLQGLSGHCPTSTLGQNLVEAYQTISWTSCSIDWIYHDQVPVYSLDRINSWTSVWIDNFVVQRYPNGVDAEPFAFDM